VIVRGSRDPQEIHAALEGDRRGEPGGTARLWDGLLEATRLVRGVDDAGAVSGGAQGVVLLFWASEADGGSVGNTTQIEAALTGSPVVPLWVVQHRASAMELAPLAAASGGGILPTTVAESTRSRLLSAGGAAVGSWQLSVRLGEPLPQSPPGSTVSGKVTLEAAGDSWSRSFDLPVLQR
jgi:hypothetical protein